MGKESLKSIFEKREQNGFGSKEAKKVIVSILKVYRDSPEIVEDLFLHKKMPFQSEILNILGLGEDIKELIKKYIENNNFTEDNHLFKELNRIFEAKYDISSRVYKYDETKKYIKLIYGNPEEFAERVNLQEFKNGHYINELESLKKGNDSKFFYNKSIKSFGSKGSICIDVLGEKFLFVFGDSQTPTKNIKKIRSLFDNLNLGNTIKSKLILIREKYKDGLTSLYNYRYINEVMQNKPAAIIFVDVNEMKKINDVYGYTQANKILIEISNILLESVRHGDKVCRFGGDEFVIFVKQNDEDIILSIKNRIEKKLEERNKNADFEVKLSIGYSMYDETKDFDTRLVEAGKDMKNNKSLDGKIYRIINDVMDLEKGYQIKTAEKILQILDENEKQKIVQKNCSIAAKSGNCSTQKCS